MRSTATRAALLAVARPRFATRGFDAVSAEELVGAAELTRGALYHHFGGKPGLFAAVHEALHAEVAERIARAADTAAARTGDAWQALEAGCLAFLDACTDGEFLRIALMDAPGVLGWDEWRAVDSRHALGLLRTGLEEAFTSGESVASLPALELDALAHLLSGAMNEAGFWIARSTNPARARRVAGAQLLALLSGIRPGKPSSG